MSVFDKFKSLVQDLSIQNPKWGSDAIASYIQSKHDPSINAGSLGRVIRRSGWLQKKPFASARVLSFDIETAPMLSYHWGLWNQNIYIDNVHKDWCILTWAAKWIFEDKVYSERISPDEVIERDDKRVVKSLWNLLDQADIVIAHNAKKFDVRIANARFLKHGLKPPSHYQVVDTLKVARKQFRLMSNKLDDICTYMGIGGKMETPKGLWKKAVEGDQEAIYIMDEYCVQDVKILEDVYFELRPWIKPHPNLNLLEDPDGSNKCPTCASMNLSYDGDYVTYANRFHNFRCGDCGSLSRSRVNSTGKETRDVLLIPNP